MKKEKINIEDAKKKASGFFGYIKHLVKDPVRDMAQAKARRKELLTFLGISLGLVIVPTVTYSIASKIFSLGYDNIILDIVTIPVGIGVIGALFAGIMCLFLLKITLVLKLLQCSKCKNQVAYGDSVKYSVLREWVKKEVSSQNGRTTVKQTEMAEVLIDCICQNCGTPKQIKREFRVAYYVDGSLKYSHDLDKLVKGMFTGEFIQ